MGRSGAGDDVLSERCWATGWHFKHDRRVVVAPSRSATRVPTRHFSRPNTAVPATCLRSCGNHASLRTRAHPGNATTRSAACLVRIQPDSIASIAFAPFLRFSSIRGFCSRSRPNPSTGQNDTVLRQFRDSKRQVLDFAEQMLCSASRWRVTAGGEGLRQCST